MEISRRAALTGGSALALAAGLPTAAFAFPAWEARSGLNAAQYQAVFDQMTAQGYRPLVVDGYSVGGGDPLFAAIWMQLPGAAWVARHNMNAGAYQNAFDTFQTQGFRPRWITSYPTPGGDLYAAIWDKSGSAGWVARHGLSPAAFQQAFDQFTAQGYRLTCTSATMNGQSGIWEKLPGPFYAYSGMTSAAYQQRFDQLGAQGFRLRQVKGYNTMAGPRFAAIWDQDGSSAWEAHHNMNAVQFQQTFDQLNAAGFWLSDVTGYDSGGQVTYAGIWQKA
ncbi:MAG: hypothetical protein ISS15_05715 [Alphaproteobacteria bacterium]|nr:hypothetical protein [Alphaproteobacteria bacterium]MBL7097137.1 hypothetical protein [Alphaproteobacteria bacterium]